MSEVKYRFFPYFSHINPIFIPYLDSGGSQHAATFYPILPQRVVNVIPLWGAVSAIRLRESFLTKAGRNPGECQISTHFCNRMSEAHSDLFFIPNITHRSHIAVHAMNHRPGKTFTSNLLYFFPFSHLVVPCFSPLLGVEIAGGVGALTYFSRFHIWFLVFSP